MVSHTKGSLHALFSATFWLTVVLLDSTNFLTYAFTHGASRSGLRPSESLTNQVPIKLTQLFLTPTKKDQDLAKKEKQPFFLGSKSSAVEASPSSTAEKSIKSNWNPFLKQRFGEMDTSTLKESKLTGKRNVRKPTAPLSELQDSASPMALNLESPEKIFGIAVAAGLGVLAAIGSSIGLTPDDLVHGFQTLTTNPQTFFQEILDGVKDLGPSGPLYFSLIYMVAEILAIPATPLTLSAGYLFGAQEGILAVLAGATGAACIGFWISRTFLRDYVESTLLAPSETLTNGKESGKSGSNNTLIKLDKAIGKEGFKLLILVRLSPIFPFSITNYLYGASSIDFGPYLLGTLIGFVPSTTAYVYTGMVGQALTIGQGGDQPWYVYAGGIGVLSVLLKLVTDVANGIIEAIDEEES